MQHTKLFNIKKKKLFIYQFKKILHISIFTKQQKIPNNFTDHCILSFEKCAETQTELDMSNSLICKVSWPCKAYTTVITPQEVQLKVLPVQ